MGKLIRFAFAALAITLTSAPMRATAQTADTTRLPSVPLAATSPAAVAAPLAPYARTATASATASPAAPATPVSYYQRPPDNAYYSRPTTPAASYAALPTPAAVTTPAASAIPAAAPTAIAAIIPPSPPAPAASASASATTEGLRLVLSDPVSATSDPLNWSFKASKSHHEAEVFYKGRLYKTYHAVFGRSRFAGAKQWEGDRRTPEGNYLIVAKHPSGRFRWFLKINYPNATDQASFTHLKADGDIPRGLREGGSVGIHGTDNPILNIGNVDWTTGCISVDNSDISELARLLPIGTLVVIKP